jgi:hypothetical protein
MNAVGSSQDAGRDARCSRWSRRGEQALLLGNIGGEGCGVRGCTRRDRWQKPRGAAPILGGVRILGYARRRADRRHATRCRQRSGVVGSTRRVRRCCEVRAGQVRDRRADPIRTLDAIVALGHDTSFIALGRGSHCQEASPRPTTEQVLPRRTAQRQVMLLAAEAQARRWVFGRVLLVHDR